MTSTAPDQEMTDVVFRRWYRKIDGNGIIALFPDEPHGQPGMVLSYERIGLHGSADYERVMAVTRPASPTEYEELERELTSYPYNYRLRVKKRRNGRQS